MADKADRTKIILITCCTMLLAMLSSCGWLGNEVEKGCTQCFAENYNPEAVLEDASCVYKNEEIIGVYAVRDSLFDSTGAVVVRDYELSIFYDDCNSEEYLIHNLGELKNNATGEAVPFDVQFDAERLILIKQSYYSNINETLSYYYLERSTGSIGAGRIQIDYAYTSDRKSFRATLKGEKIEELL